MKTIRLTEDMGKAKKGMVFIQGLHGVPNHETWKKYSSNQFYWKKNSKKEDGMFLFEYWLWGKVGKEEWNRAIYI